MVSVVSGDRLPKNALGRLNAEKRALSVTLSADVARWLAKGNTIVEVDYTANAGWLADRYRRVHGRSAFTARAEIARTNAGFFRAQKKDPEGS